VGQFCWNHEEFVAQGSKRRGLKRVRQTQTFEPVDKVVRKEEEMKARFVGSKVFRWNLSHGIVALQFTNSEFDGCTLIVEAPYIKVKQNQRKSIFDLHPLKRTSVDE
jgi:hypothetical protein